MTQTYGTLDAATDSAADFPSQNWNTQRDSLLTMHSGSSRPSYAQKGTFWLHETSGIIYFYDGATDVFFSSIDSTQHRREEPMGGGIKTIATADTIDLGATPESLLFLTGTATVTSFGSSMAAGQVKVCVSNDSFILTHNATTLQLPGNANITTASNDVFAVICTDDSKYKLLFYTQAATSNSEFSSGDFKFTLRTTADVGWVMADDGTIGNATSGATTRSNEDTRALYKVLWAIDDTYAPVTGGRGGSADADFDAGKEIALTKMLGRALAVAGSGSGLTARNLGQVFGEEGHALTSGENGPHTHSITDPGHGHNFHVSGGGGGALSRLNGTTNQLDSIYLTDISTSNITINSSGSGTAHNTMQPTSFCNVMIKL